MRRRLDQGALQCEVNSVTGAVWSEEDSGIGDCEV